MKVLMSIKPLYAEQILQGKKKYEYRRRIFKRSDVSSLVIYESAPVSLVVGEVKIFLTRLMSFGRKQISTVA